MTLKRYGNIVSGEEVIGVQRDPSQEEQRVINEYRQKFKEAMGYPPHGLHYLPFLGGVWLPPKDQNLAWLPPEERGVEGQLKRMSLPQ